MIDPMVSVSMITYNHAPFIADAIERILNQKTEFAIELVIGEDCSTDGTREIVFQYQKKHPDIIRVVTSERNVGARKNGLRTLAACRGKYIAFCEGDDIWHHSEKLKLQVDYLKNHPDCGLVYSDFDRHEVDKRITIKNYIHNKANRCSQPPSITDILRGRSGIRTCTVITEKRLVDHFVNSDPYLYQDGPFLMGDTQLWAEISTVKYIYYLDQSLATHLILQESATQSKDLSKKLKFRMSGAELCIYLSSKYSLPDHLNKRHKKILNNLSLKLALIGNNADLAKQVRMRMERITWKESILYYCTISTHLRRIFIPYLLSYAEKKW